MLSQLSARGNVWLGVASGLLVRRCAADPPGVIDVIHPTSLSLLFSAKDVGHRNDFVVNSIPTDLHQ
jgi:hypothetical protein